MEIKQKSIKSNFIYNTLFRLLNILFPLVTFPYVARILTADGIGKVNFSLTVIQLFILIAQVGIPTYAIRECAKYRDDKEKLSKTVQEILVINTIMILVAYLLFFIILNNSDTLKDYNTILLIMSVSIITTNLGVEWFFQAIEEYRLIAVRNIIVKLISLILIFTLVKHESDYIIYGSITVLTASLGYVYNFINVNRYIKIFKVYQNYNFKRHLKPIMVLFGMSVSTSIYLSLDKIMLGYIAGARSLGYYVAASNLIIVLISLVTSLGTVLLPRMSYYIENNQKYELNELIKKSIDFILLIPIPATIGITILAEPIILIFAGTDYIDAVSTIRILSPIIIVLAISNLIGIQILVSHGKEKITLISTIFGALVNFSLNLILIPKFHENGVAIGTVTAEITVALIQLIFAYSYIKNNVNYKNILFYLMGGVLISITSLILYHYINGGIILTTILTILTSIIIYISFLYLIKNELIINLTISLKRILTGK